MTEADQLRESLLIAETRNLQLEFQIQHLSELLADAKKEQKTNRVKQSPGRREMIFRRCKGECFYCGTLILEDEFSVDHVMPLSRGGSNLLQNLVAACVRCNNRKGDRLPSNQELERAESLHSRRPHGAQTRKEREPELPMNPLDKAFQAMRADANVKRYRVRSDHRNRHHNIGHS